MKTLCMLSLAVALGAWSVTATRAADPATKGEAAESVVDKVKDAVKGR